MGSSIAEWVFYRRWEVEWGSHRKVREHERREVGKIAQLVIEPGCVKGVLQRLCTHDWHNTAVKLNQAKSKC